VNRWTAERWAASSGILFVILYVVGNLITGEPPDYNASGAEIGDFFIDKHAELTVQAIIFGVIVVVWLWFLASFAGTFREAGQRRLATIMYGAGVAGITIGAVGDAIMFSAVQLRPVLDPGSVQAIYGMSFFLFIKVFWPLAALAFATSLATLRSHALPGRYGYLSAAGGVVFVLGGVSIRMFEFFSPEGAMPLIGSVVFAVWVLLTSILLVRKLAGESVVASPATR
jgi:hypothetical protein